MIIIAKPELAERRGWDKFGGGHFGAPRGTRTHKGVDYKAPPGCIVLAPVGGVVTKIGYPYGDDTGYRYVEITAGDDSRHRVFYVQPIRVQNGDEVARFAPIGLAQDLERRYPGIVSHIHYEIILPGGAFLDPAAYDHVN